MYRLASLSMVCLTLAIFLTGCGGGGGGASSGGIFTPPVQNGGSAPPTVSPPTTPSPNIATVIQGSIAFPPTQLIQLHGSVYLELILP